MKIYLSYRERMAGMLMVFTLLGVLAFIVGTAVQNQWFESRVRFHTIVERGDALRSGSPVFLSGIEIGEIGDLTIMKDNRVSIELLVRQRYADRVRRGMVAEIRRLVGLGEKRILLNIGDEELRGPLPPGSLIPSNEPMDIIDAIAKVDLGKYMETMDRAVAAMEVTLSKLEEKNRLERMMEAFDQMGPTMIKLNNLLTDLHAPLVEVMSNPSVPEAFDGAAKVFNDKNTRMTMAHMAATFEPERMDVLLKRMDAAFKEVDALSRKGGELRVAMGNANRIMNDQRIDRMIDSIEKLTDAEKLGRLVDNMDIIARETAKMGPEIPRLTKELIETLHEAVIVLDALKRSWLLRKKVEEGDKERQKQ